MEGEKCLRMDSGMLSYVSNHSPSLDMAYTDVIMVLIQTSLTYWLTRPVILCRGEPTL